MACDTDGSQLSRACGSLYPPSTPAQPPFVCPGEHWNAQIKLVDNQDRYGRFGTAEQALAKFCNSFSRPGSEIEIGLLILRHSRASWSGSSRRRAILELLKGSSSE